MRKDSCFPDQRLGVWEFPQTRRLTLFFHVCPPNLVAIGRPFLNSGGDLAHSPGF